MRCTPPFCRPAPPALRATSPLCGEDFLLRFAPPPHFVGRTSCCASRHLPTLWGGLPVALRATSPLWGGDFLLRFAPPPHFVGRTCYSTVTDLARFLGWSTSWPSLTPMWYANSCSITVLRTTDASSSTFGITNTSVATPSSERSPSVTSASTGALRATISCTLLTIFSLVELAVQTATTGNSSSSSAIGPCFSSPPDVPSAWTYEISLSFSAPSSATG